MSKINEYKISDEVMKEIKSLVYDQYATCVYEVMSGGLIWSDEITNKLEIKMINCGFHNTLRLLLAYRASLIKQKEILEFRALWSEILSIVPSWPLFREERKSPILKSILLELQEEETKCISRILGDKRE